MRHARRKPVVFVITPFREEFLDVYSRSINPACLAAGALCLRVDGPGFSSAILAEIEQHIRDADLIVADLTGSDPNVIYEFGYAYSLNKKIILLARDLNDIPFDLRHHHVIIYRNVRHAEDRLRERLTPLIGEVLRKVKEGGAPGDSQTSVVSGEGHEHETSPRDREESQRPRVRGGAADIDRSKGLGTEDFDSPFEDSADDLVEAQNEVEYRGKTAVQSISRPKSTGLEESTDIFPEGAGRGQVFISYSHDDDRWLTMLMIMAKPLVWSGKVEFWSDAKIKPGEKWEEKIEQALATARVALLLVSPNFLASDYIMKNELPYILEAAERRRLTLLWVALGTCFFDKTKIALYQAANDPEKPLETLNGPKRNQALRHICEQIGRALGLE